MILKEFKIPGNPKALKRHRAFKRGNFAGTYDPSKGDKADFLAKAMEHRPDNPYDMPLRVRIDCFFKRPKNHFGTGKNSGKLKYSAPYWHTKIPDADNLAKFVCDSLNGVFWKDDARVCVLEVRKLYGRNPQISILIETLTDGD